MLRHYQAAIQLTPSSDQTVMLSTRAGALLLYLCCLRCLACDQCDGRQMRTSQGEQLINAPIHLRTVTLESGLVTYLAAHPHRLQTRNDCRIQLISVCGGRAGRKYAQLSRTTENAGAPTPLLCLCTPGLQHLGVTACRCEPRTNADYAQPTRRTRAQLILLASHRCATARRNTAMTCTLKAYNSNTYRQWCGTILRMLIRVYIEVCIVRGAYDQHASHWQ